MLGLEDGSINFLFANLLIVSVKMMTPFLRITAITTTPPTTPLRRCSLIFVFAVFASDRTLAALRASDFGTSFRKLLDEVH